MAKQNSEAGLKPRPGACLKKSGTKSRLDKTNSMRDKRLRKSDKFCERAKSIGFAGMETDSDDPEQMKIVADDRMGKSSRGGAN